MLKIRLAEPSDLPNILNVMKLALGDTHGRRNPEFWKWKHEDNPFGRSAVMVAEENGVIAGVRAMMRWEFRKGTDIIRAWRAVDTSTHPDFRGKGLLSKLNSEMIGHLSDLGPALIFNTPNPVSQKIYFNQGWEPAGSAATSVKPIIINLIKNRFGSGAKNHHQLGFVNPAEESISALGKLLNNQLTTNWNQQRLKWRYMNVPGTDYYSLNHDSGAVIYRIVNRGSLRELRITELFPNSELIKDDITNLIRSLNPDLVTFLEDGQGLLRKFVPTGFIRISQFSPKLVCRQLNDKEIFSWFKQENSRYFSAGTLELF